MTGNLCAIGGEGVDLHGRKSEDGEGGEGEQLEQLESGHYG